MSKITTETTFRYDCRDDTPLFTGKHPVRIKNFWDNIPLNLDASYPLLRLEIEITDRCNDTCEHCGMHANRLNRTLSYREIDEILAQTKDAGFLSVSFTGGEPFIEFSALEYAVKRASLIGLDVTKITSNGFWGENAKSYFDRLEGAGLFKNKYFVPTIMLSIGEQSIDISRIASAYKYLTDTYSTDEISLSLSTLAVKGEGFSRTSILQQIYKDRFDINFPERVEISERFYVGFKDDAQESRKTFKDIIRTGHKCFEPTVGSFIFPIGLLKLNGDFSTCACFDAPKRLIFGNIYDTPLKELIETVNHDEYVKMMRIYSLEEVFLLKNLPKDLLSRECDSYCHACSMMIEYLGI